MGRPLSGRANTHSGNTSDVRSRQSLLTSLLLLQGPSDLPTLANNCHWMNATVYDWIFKVPILTVMALNSIFLVMIMWVCISGTKQNIQKMTMICPAL